MHEFYAMRPIWLAPVPTQQLQLPGRFVIVPSLFLKSPGFMPAGQAPMYFWSITTVMELIPRNAGGYELVTSECAALSPENVTVRLI